MNSTMERLRIVMLGTMGHVPFGGHVWVHLNWLRGFNALGHEVWYVEDDSTWPFDPDQNSVVGDCAYAVRNIPRWLESTGLPARWAFRLGPGKPCWGMTETQLIELYRSCDLLINMAGATTLHEDHLAAPLKVMLHTDPGAAELRLANGDDYTQVAFEQHDFIATCGENSGKSDCLLPMNGLEAKYRSTRQAVDTELWPMAFDADAIAFTTIGNWKQTGSDVEYRGEVYRWSKHHEWLKFIDLPRRTMQRFEAALKIDDEADRQKLLSNGWSVISPGPWSTDVLGAYPDYIRRSRGSWTVSKDQYTRLRTGWFSDREATYLASGKPVIAQETGFSKTLPTGRGLFQFSTMDDVLAAIDAINSNYRLHCEAAREIADEYFGARKVTSSLLRDIKIDKANDPAR
jgi:hypothetical protein